MSVQIVKVGIGLLGDNNMKKRRARGNLNKDVKHSMKLLFKPKIQKKTRKRTTQGKLWK